MAGDGVAAALGRLRASRLRISVTARDAIEWGGFLGSTLRGGFLAGLFDVGCVVESRDCRTCELRDSCPIPRIGGEHEDPSPARTALYRVVPPESDAGVEPGGSFAFGIDLFGDASEARSLAIAAVERFAGRGVGRRRARFEIDSIAASASPTLREELDARIGELAGAASDAVEIRLRSPLRVVVDGRQLSSFSFDPFVRSLVRRARLLLESAEGVALEFDHRELRALAAAVRVVDARTSKRDQVRFSSRQGRSMNLHGIEGSVVLAGELAPFFPWLAFGEAVGVGKGATFGHGVYSCRAVRLEVPGVSSR